MKHYSYVVVGGGMAADSAIKGFREVDGTGSIALIASENFPPYDRPPLTKALWTGKKTLDKVWRQTASHGADLYLNQRVTAIDPAAKRVRDDQGLEYEYDKLLLATGGTPRELPFGKGLIRYYRTMADYQALREQADKGGRFAVIGGGFIGSELAAALAMHKQEVTIIFPGKGICANIFPPGLVDHLNNYFHEKGVVVLNGEEVSDVQASGNSRQVKMKSGKSIEVDHIVAGIGIKPNVELAEKAGLEIDNGIVVGEDLQTSHADIYAAGDVATFTNSYLGGRLRVEHEDNTNTMGKAAGRSMAGKPQPYDHIPMFYSDLFDLGYEAAGRLDSRYQMVEDWKEQPYKKGVVYYLDDGHLRGVLLWNVWDEVDAARDLIRSVGPKVANQMPGKI
ncbi:MAG: FAD-dependent oxidoreductase [Chloroflexi bacterium]|nr:FAD-dependent oxidoreductase [Chloroflexota bacterium]